jgi:CBS domain-containing protein
MLFRTPTAPGAQLSSPTIVAAVRQFLVAHPPFSLMSGEDVEFVARAVDVAYFARGELLIGPEAGPPTGCFIVKQGTVEGVPPAARDGAAERDAAAVRLLPGEVFPVGALMAERPVGSEYRAAGDVFCWILPKRQFDELLRRSEVFLDFCKRRTAALLDLSQQALQASYARQATQWRSMAAPLGDLVRREAVTVAAATTLREVFERMEREGVGSVIVEPDGAAGHTGIFTRQDVIGRVVLPGLPLESPISSVMTAPVVTMDVGATVAEAMLTMARHSIRHIPVTRDGRLAGVVTERDLFVLQRQTLRSIGESIRSARDVDDLARATADIRAWSRSLVAQGVSAEFVTRLISRLNDQVAQRLIERAAGEHRVSLADACWLALGSEGREEQTIASDQDNGLVLADSAAGQRERFLAFAQAVNRDLDRCGYELCRGGIMAGNPKWCLTLSEWRALFDSWIDRGDPESLLSASIFFDFRPLAGDAALAATLRAHVGAQAAANRRFLKQMSDNALRNGPPSSWTAGVLEQLFTQQATKVDLKLNGTVPFVDAARLLALAHRVEATGTAERFDALVRRGALPEVEARAWRDSFQFLQGLRLRVQHDPTAGRVADAAGADGDAGDAGGGDALPPGTNPNLLDAALLSELDRRILKETFRQARKLQQRLELDFPG